MNYRVIINVLRSRDMCLEISSNWGSQTWQDFDQLCEYNPVETELINCLADVREPCQLGCKDLTYCTNFNNRSVLLLTHFKMAVLWSLHVSDMLSTYVGGSSQEPEFVLCQHKL